MKGKTPEKEGNKRGDLLVRRISDVQVKPVKWLWPNRFALGKLSMIAGNPGLGKSQITASLAAITTTGGRFPMEYAPVEQGCVLFLSAEDDAEDTIRPRLEAAGADLEKVYVLDAVSNGYVRGEEMRRSFNLKADIQRLSEYISSLPDMRLVIVDPISAYMGDVDSHNTGDVRSALAPLTDMAAKYDVAVIAVAHLNKSISQDALAKISGSMAFVAASRAAFVVVRDNEDEEKRLFLPVKNNIGKDRGGLSFSVESCKLDCGIETSRIVWGGTEVTKTANEVMSQSHEGNEDKTAMEEAKDFIKEIFYDAETVFANDMKSQARSLGISERTLRRALNGMGAESRKEPKQGGKWYWYLPNRAEQTANLSKSSNLSNFYKGGENGRIKPESENFAMHIQHGQLGLVGRVRAEIIDNIDISNLSKNGLAGEVVQGELVQAPEKAGWGSVTCYACQWWNSTGNRCTNVAQSAGNVDPNKLKVCEGYKKAG